MDFIRANRVSNSLVLKLGGDKYRAFIKLYLCWKNAVGDLLAEKSHPFRYRDSILYVSVQNNSWMQELILHKKHLIEKCQQLSKEPVQDIVFMLRAK